MGSLVHLAARQGGRGRQPADVEALRDTRDELAALIAEGRDLAAELVTVARTAQMRLARGQSPADLLDRIERLGTRHAARMAAASVESHQDDLCPDGETVRHLGHGRAA